MVEALERLGSPEGVLALAQAVTYLASVPKSNAVYLAWKKALSDVGLSPLLMSRCALIVKVQNMSKEERIDLFRKKFYGGAEIKESAFLLL